MATSYSRLPQQRSCSSTTLLTNASEGCLDVSVCIIACPKCKPGRKGKDFRIPLRLPQVSDDDVLKTMEDFLEPTLQQFKTEYNLFVPTQQFRAHGFKYSDRVYSYMNKEGLEMILDASCMAPAFHSYVTDKPDVVRDRDSVCLSIRSSVFNVEYAEDQKSPAMLESIIVTDAIGEFTLQDSPMSLNEKMQSIPYNAPLPPDQDPYEIYTIPNESQGPLDAPSTTSPPVGAEGHTLNEDCQSIRSRKSIISSCSSLSSGSQQTTITAGSSNRGGLPRSNSLISGMSTKSSLDELEENAYSSEVPQCAIWEHIESRNIAEQGVYILQSTPVDMQESVPYVLWYYRSLNRERRKTLRLIIRDGKGKIFIHEKKRFKDMKELIKYYRKNSVENDCEKKLGRQLRGGRDSSCVCGNGCIMDLRKQI